MVTHVAAHDQGYVTAPPGAVYRLLRDPEAYPRWWPGARGSGGLDLGPVRGLGVRAGHLREDLGLVLELSGPATGTLEWHLEPFEDGTIVNAILNLDLPVGARRAERRLLGARAGIRRGMVGLKRALEPASREAR